MAQDERAYGAAAGACATVERPASAEAEQAEGDALSTMPAVLEGRAAFYEMLASLFYGPLSEEQIDAMARQDFSAYRGLNEDFDSGINDMARYLRKRNTGTRQELACDFTSSIGGTKSYAGKFAVPYESVFTSEEGLLCRDAFHEVLGTYRRACLRKKDGLNIPEDHISFQFQFLAILSRRAAAHLGNADVAGSVDDLAKSRSFLDEHVLNWFDDFRDRALLIVGTRFYRGVFALARGYLMFDRGLLDDCIEVLGS